MSQITITIDTPDTLERRDFAFQIAEALRIGFEHEYDMWTVEPKCGRWIEASTDGAVFCSECGTEWLSESAKYYNFCPNCGARMEGEQ